ncbi:MAG: IMP dehydrogenase [Nitrospirae bacterium]|nr:IMP dehydrogenase [Nitrospirota bacterium]
MLNLKVPEGLTFDDVSLIPAHSSVHPRQVVVDTRLTRHVTINIPIISAAMDTVTEARLAVALAREGGVGILHRALSIEQQATEVEKVKKSESGMIIDPITIAPEQRLHEALELMGRYKISGIPVTKAGKLVGVLTNRDIRFEKNLALRVSDVMTKKNLITTPVGTTLEQAAKILHEHRIEKLPVVNDRGELKGLITIKDIEKKIKYPNACKDRYGRLRIGAAVGVADDTKERAQVLVKMGVDVLAVDTAHGHSSAVIETVRAIKRAHPEVDVIAGNIATRDAARDLIKAGADGLKVGIGPGSICTTRVVAGAGVPQLTAIANVAAAAAKSNVPVIADGGVKFSGDLTKAIAAGAHAVMIGGLFAGTEESPGELMLFQGRSYKIYRGMGSIGAMERGGKDRYSQEFVPTAKLVPEGIEGRVPFKGALSEVVFQLVGGLRSGMGYCGCRTIDELRRKAKFIRVSVAGLRESHVHDVIITKEAPNYRREWEG